MTPKLGPLHDAAEVTPDTRTVPAGRLSPQQIADALRAGGPLSDAAFDEYLPAEWQAASSLHWTPLDTVRQVGRWFDLFGIRTVVDIGSGAGKFCVALALCGNYRVIGIEQRPRLVAAARTLAHDFQVSDRVQFREEQLQPNALPHAQAYYLYNSFGENMLPQNEHLDTGVELSRARYRRDVATMQSILRAALTGTYVVTYHGMGGRVPASYDEIFANRGPGQLLRVWRKMRSEDAPPSV